MTTGIARCTSWRRSSTSSLPGWSSRVARGSSGERSEGTAEQVEGQAQGRARHLGVVARALVPHEGVLRVELVPTEEEAGLRQRVVDGGPPLGGDLWGLV